MAPTDGHDPAPPPHIPSLDGVRGIAILLVLMNNFYDGPARGGLEYATYHVFKSGWSGVDLFFVLSGFLITGILLDTLGSRGYYRDFYARRVLRIFPIYYLALLAWPWLVSAFGSLPAEGQASLHDALPWYWTYLQNLHFALQLPPHPGEPTSYWSLATEEQFYLLWPWLVARTGRRLPLVCLAAIGMAPVLRLAWHLHAPGVLAFEGVTGLVPTRMDSFALGALLAWLLREPGWRDALRRACRPLALGGAALLGVLFLVQQGLRNTTVPGQVIGYSVVAMAAAGLVLLAVADAPGGLPRRLLGWPPLRACGRYSYGTYVVHVVLLEFTLHLGHPSERTGGAGTVISWAVAMTLLLATLSLLGGFASYHLVEKHFLRLKRYFPSQARVPAVWGPPPGSPR